MYSQRFFGLSLMLLATGCATSAFGSGLPSEYRGKWAAQLAECKMKDAQANIFISRNRIDYWEYSEKIVNVVVETKWRVSLDIEAIGTDDKTFRTKEILELMPDGKMSFTSSAGVYIYYKCKG